MPRFEELMFIARDMACECGDAIDTHGSFNSAHEGYSVILEELEELWDEIKKKREHRNKKLMKKEALQVGAMAIKFVYTLCQEDSE